MQVALRVLHKLLRIHFVFLPVCWLINLVWSFGQEPVETPYLLVKIETRCKHDESHHGTKFVKNILNQYDIILGQLPVLMQLNC